MRWMLSIAVVIVTSTTLFAQESELSEFEQQNAAFRRWWGEDLVWKFDDLPLEGDVPDWRVPYSGHDYPDRQGGTGWAMRMYDAAFRTGGQAASWERWDTTAYKEPRGGRQPRGLLGRLFAGRPQTPHWHGHCNGWTAASIRHAEPENSVVKNGVTFSPAAIKALLAEVYMYQDIEYLGGEGYAINPATFHVVLTNWLGRGEHPIGVDTTLGKEVWNYPIYSYKATAHKHSPRLVEVSMNFVYANSTRQEFDEGPQLAKQIYMHYQLTLDNQGKITGGSFYNDSNQIDILWAPVAPVEAGQPGNERGNPHINVKEIMAIWRASVPEEKRRRWMNINPLAEDIAQADSESDAESNPSQEPPAEPVAETASSENAASSDAESTESEPADTESTESDSDGDVSENLNDDPVL